MATSRRTATNENVSTFGGAGQGRDYTDLTVWEAATDIDLVGAAQSEVLECYDDQASYDQRVNVGGATTNASYFRIIRPAGTIGTGSWEGHDGTPNNGVYFNNTVADETFYYNGEAYSSVQDIIVSHTIAGSSTHIAVRLDGAANMLAVGMILVDVTSGSGEARGLRLADECIAVNCLAIRVDEAGFMGDSSGLTDWFYNCTAIDNGVYGFDDTGGSNIVLCKNCLGDNNAPEDFDSVGTFTGSLNNASGDATAQGTNNRINQTFTFVNAGNDDYHLTNTDAGARTYGVDLSADSIFAFDDDIDGQTRS